MSGNRLYKYEKLCSVTAVNAIFTGGGKNIRSYPLRCVFRKVPSRVADKPVVRFLISVPKRQLRHAVDRVLIRRRVREAYRLSRHLINPAVAEVGCDIEVVFIYMSDGLKNYESIRKSMESLLSDIAKCVMQKESED